jgi:hypothetical protein
METSDALDEKMFKNAFIASYIINHPKAQLENIFQYADMAWDKISTKAGEIYDESRGNW